MSEDRAYRLGLMAAQRLLIAECQRLLDEHNRLCESPFGIFRWKQRHRIIGACAAMRALSSAITGEVTDLQRLKLELRTADGH